MNLGVVGKQFDECTTQPDCLCRKLVAAAVALVEYQVDDRQDGVETLAEQMSRRDTKGDGRGLDLALAAYQPLRQGGLPAHESPPDLVGGEPAPRASGARNLRRDR